VYCKGGYRSAIAASLLQRAGFERVMNVTGGFDAWSACHLPITTSEPTVAAT
jgi:hydroxyacylglutathione hydrolase